MPLDDHGQLNAPSTAPPDGGDRSLRAQAVFGWLLVAGFVALVAVVGDHRTHVRLFQAAWVVGFAGYALVLRAVWLLPPARVPGRWGIWLLGFLLLRVALLHTEPGDDVHRYVWEGKIQGAGFNPYSTPPTDDRLRPLRAGDENWPRINHPDYPAIYPPLAQLLFRAAARLSNSVQVTKAALVALEMVLIVLLGRLLPLHGVSPNRAAVYALCPLTLTAFGIDGHVDSLMLLWLVLAALFAARQSFYACAAALGLGIASKLVCVVLLPWLIVKKPTAAVLAIAVTGLTYLPFADAGPGVYAGLVRFSANVTCLSLFVGPLELLFGAQVARWVCAVGLAAFLGYLATRSCGYAVYATRALAGLVLLLPVVHLWYLTWFLLFAWARPRIAWLVLAGAMGGYVEGERVRALTGEWGLPAWVYATLYAPFLIACAVEAARRRKGRTKPAPPRTSISQSAGSR